MKYCPKCGAEVSDSDQFCSHCGCKIEETKDIFDIKTTSSSTSSSVPVEEKNMVLYIILTLVTCGIFGYYWMYRLTEDLNALYPDDYYTSGGTVVLLTIVTCGIYGFYWAYKMGQKVSKDTSTPLLYLLCYALVGVITYVLLQIEVNKRSTKK